MNLIYLDESGNSGSNLADPQQPVFCLCALIVEEEAWQPLNGALQAVVAEHFPSGTPDGFEVHGSDLRNGSGFFKGAPVSARVEFRNRWLATAGQHGVRIIYRAIEKRRYGAWLQATFGSGIVINPHVVAFALLANVVNEYLRSLPDAPLGLFISDENREITVDVEKSIKVSGTPSGQ